MKSTGVVSGKRYNSLGVSEGYGQQIQHNSFSSVGRDGVVTKASILEAQQKIKDIIDKKPNLQGRNQSEDRGISNFSAKKNSQASN